MLLFALILSFVAVSVGLVWFLLAHDHGEKEPIGMLWMAVFLGALGGFAAMLLERWIIDAKDLLPGVSIATLATAALCIGVIEEACKFGPLALVIYHKRYFNEHTDGIIYFALAGLGFGLPENVLYTMQYGPKTGVLRMFLTPLFHAGLTAIVGYFLVKRKLAGKSPWGILPVLGAAMAVHGLYDFGLISGIPFMAGVSVLITLLITATMFALYVRATELDQEMGLSAVGHNAYCRSCGHPNPKHHLYCTKCGKNA
ncbi:MAG: PrsW family glutamic-type intramembrane protease [Candidatus Saccharimonadales bacterium]